MRSGKPSTRRRAKPSRSPPPRRTGCDDCLSAHTYLGKRAGLAASDIEAARDGSGADPKIAAAARFARRLVETRGHVTAADLLEVRRAGFEDGQILDFVANVAWSTFTKYVNEVAETPIDFEPVVRRRPR